MLKKKNPLGVELGDLELGDFMDKQRKESMKNHLVRWGNNSGSGRKAPSQIRAGFKG